MSWLRAKELRHTKRAELKSQQALNSLSDVVVCVQYIACEEDTRTCDKDIMHIIGPEHGLASRRATEARSHPAGRHPCMIVIYAECIAILHA